MVENFPGMTDAFRLVQLIAFPGWKWKLLLQVGNGNCFCRRIAFNSVIF